MWQGTRRYRFYDKQHLHEHCHGSDNQNRKQSRKHVKSKHNDGNSTNTPMGLASVLHHLTASSVLVFIGCWISCRECNSTTRRKAELGLGTILIEIASPGNQVGTAIIRNVTPLSVIYEPARSSKVCASRSTNLPKPGLWG